MLSIRSIRSSVVALAAFTSLLGIAQANGLTDQLKAQAEKYQQNNAATSTSNSSSTHSESGSGLAAGLGGLLGGSSASGSSSSAGASAISGLSSLGLPSVAQGSASNVAGVLQYCVKQKYLKAANVDSLKEKLLGKVGLGSTKEAESDSGYQSGLSGILSGNGHSFDLSKVKDNIKDKACDYVLDNAGSLL